MRKGLIALSIVALAALLINGCVTAKKEQKKVSFENITGETVVVKPGGWHENCDKVLAGETFNVAFKSSKPGLYEIHYHLRGEKHDYQAQTLADGYRGSIKAQEDAVYCLMFFNKSRENITLTYEMSVEKQ